MKLVSYNVNGLKAFYNHGGLEAVMSEFQNPDLICFQETKTDDAKFEYWVSDYNDSYATFHTGSSYKSGYAGCGIMLKKSLESSLLNIDHKELGDTYESGRIVHLEFPDFHYIGVYTLNSGNKDDLRIQWDKDFGNWIWKLDIDKPVIIQGDLNVVNHDIDYWGLLDRYRNTMPGLMDFERDHFHKFLEVCKLSDTFRELNPRKKQFSWFSYRGGAYDNNKGWRIDYSLCSNRLMSRVTKSIIRDDMRYSDHCPILLEID